MHVLKYAIGEGVKCGPNKMVHRVRLNIKARSGIDSSLATNS
jgi:hypothetical protein